MSRRKRRCSRRATACRAATSSPASPIDSRPEIGVWAAGNVWVDTNGNMTFDPTNADYTNRDIIYSLGFTSDDVFAGNFAHSCPASVADGFDKLAVYGRVGTDWRWLIDTDNDGVPNDVTRRVDSRSAERSMACRWPGDFDGSATNGDEVGRVHRHDLVLRHEPRLPREADTALVTSMRGYPIVGDFDGDAYDDLATWTDDDVPDGLGQRRASRLGRRGRTTLHVRLYRRACAAGGRRYGRDGFDDFGMWDAEPDGYAAAGSR